MLKKCVGGNFDPICAIARQAWTSAGCTSLSSGGSLPISLWAQQRPHVHSPSDAQCIAIRLSNPPIGRCASTPSCSRSSFWLAVTWSSQPIQGPIPQPMCASTPRQHLACTARRHSRHGISRRSLEPGIPHSAQYATCFDGCRTWHERIHIQICTGTTEVAANYRDSAGHRSTYTFRAEPFVLLPLKFRLLSMARCVVVQALGMEYSRASFTADKFSTVAAHKTIIILLFNHLLSLSLPRLQGSGAPTFSLL